MALAKQTGIPSGRDSGLRERIMPMSSQMVEPLGGMQDEMARDGLRYGDPARPRYATARRDGAAPSLDWRDRNDGASGKQR